MTTLRVFKSTIPSVNFIFANGKPAIFQQGVFRTEVDWEIAALEAEIKNGHPHIYIDEAEREIDSELVDPINALRARIISEYLAAQEAAVNPANDMGSTTQESLKPANSQDVAAAAAGGDGSQHKTAARLATLKTAVSAASTVPAGK